jgi:hypothetical protein
VHKASIALLLAAIAVGGSLAAVSIASTVKGAAELFEADPRYQLTLEVDGNYYIADHGMSRADCFDRLRVATEWTNGHDRYSCDIEPLQGATR